MLRVTVICMSCCQTYQTDMAGPLRFQAGIPGESRDPVHHLPLEFPRKECDNCPLDSLMWDSSLRVIAIEEITPEPPQPAESGLDSLLKDVRRKHEARKKEADNA